MAHRLHATYIYPLIGMISQADRASLAKFGAVTGSGRWTAISAVVLLPAKGIRRISPVGVHKGCKDCERGRHDRHCECGKQSKGGATKRRLQQNSGHCDNQPG